MINESKTQFASWVSLGFIIFSLLAFWEKTIPPYDMLWSSL
jgi:hypothetical protein